MSHEASTRAATARLRLLTPTGARPVLFSRRRERVADVFTAALVMLVFLAIFGGFEWQ